MSRQERPSNQEPSVYAIHFGIDVGSWEDGGNRGYYQQEPFIQVDLPDEDRYYSVKGWEERPELPGRPSWLLLNDFDFGQPEKVEVLQKGISVNFDYIGDVTAVIIDKFSQNVMPKMGIFGPLMLPEASEIIPGYIESQQLNGGTKGSRGDREALVKNLYK
jgi:hypothetical protein